jgi:hypothetical protein
MVLARKVVEEITEIYKSTDEAEKEIEKYKGKGYNVVSKRFNAVYTEALQSAEYPSGSIYLVVKFEKILEGEE